MIGGSQSCSIHAWFSRQFTMLHAGVESVLSKDRLKESYSPAHKITMKHESKEILAFKDRLFPILLLTASGYR